MTPLYLLGTIRGEKVFTTHPDTQKIVNAQAYELREIQKCLRKLTQFRRYDAPRKELEKKIEWHPFGGP